MNFCPRSTRFILVALAGSFIWFEAICVQAAELGSTKITAVRNMVEHNDGAAKKTADVGQTVAPGQSVITRDQSLAELVATDSSTVRLGAQSVFSYDSQARLVKMDKGTMLMHSPVGSGGVVVQSGDIRAEVSPGTTFMVTATPAKCTTCQHDLQVDSVGKVACQDHPAAPTTSAGFALVVLEAGSPVRVMGADGQMVAVVPGEISVLGLKGSAAPAVYPVNITQIARTSPLINSFPNPLPSMPQIITTAYNLQGGNFAGTGTSAVAISSGGQLLTAPSPPPNPFLINFPMANNQPGQNNSGDYNNNLGSISTAAGSSGGSGLPTPTGVAGGGGGASPPSVPTIPTTPNNNGQQGISGNSGSKPTLTVSGASVLSKVYDGTRSADLVGAFLQGAVGSGVALANELSGMFAGKDVGSGIGVTTAMTLTGPNASQYNLTQPSLSGAITARPLTMSGTSIASREYDGTTTAGTVTVGTAGNLVGAETLIINGSASDFSSADVRTENLTVTYSLGNGSNGGKGSNYQLGNQAVSGSITKRTLTMGGTSIASREYDGSTTAGTATVGTAGNLVTGENLTVTLNNVANFSSADVGSENLAVTYTLADGVGGKASNYQLAGQNINGSITQRTLTMTGTSIASREYDGTTTAGTVTVGTAGNLVGTETLTITGTGSAFSVADAGTTENLTVTYSLGNGSNGGKGSNYQLGNQTVSGSITKRTLTMGGTSIASREYDGTTTAGTVTVGTAGNLVTGENLVVTLNSVANFTSADVGSENLAVTYTLADGVGGKASNYQLAGQNISGSITQRTLTMTGTSIASREYDGSTTAGAVTVGTAGNLVSGENLVVTLNNVANFTSADVGSENLAVTYTLADGVGGKASNYQLAGQNINGSITQRTLTMTGTSIASREYDGTTTAGTVTVGTAGNLVSGENLVVTLNSVANFTSADVGSENLAVTYTLADGVGGKASNYQLAGQNINGSITKRTLTMTGTSIASREYDGTTTAGTVTVGTAGNLVGSENLVVTLNSVADFTSADVGSENLAVTYTLADGVGGKASNYQLAGQSINGSITQRTLTMTGTSIASREYDGTTTAGTVTVGTAGNLVGAETLTITGTGSAFSVADAGTTENLTVTYLLGNGSNGGKGSNYQLGNQTVSGSITKRTLTMGGTSIASREYDGSTTAGTVTVGTAGNLVGTETLTITGTGSSFSVADAGTTENLTVTYSLGNGSNGGKGSNYQLGNQTVSGSITKRTLTMGGTSIASREYDGSTTAGTVTVGTAGNLVGSEDLVVSLDSVANFTSADVGSENLAVTYTLADGVGGKASNYQLAGQSINGSITQRTLTMTGTSIASREYDGTTTAGTVTVGTAGNLVGAETLTITGTGSAFSVADAGTTENLTVTYSLGNGSNGGKGSNYQLGNQTVSGSITKRTLTMGGTSIASREYDGSTTAGTVTVGTAGNLVSGENLTVTLNSVANFTSADVGSENLAVTYTLADGVGGKASNYQLAGQSINGSITQRTLTMTGTSIASREYDGSTTAGTVTVGTAGNLVGSEDLVVSLNSVANFTSKNVGSENLAVTYTLADGTTGKASNYQLAGQNINGSITKRTLTMTGTSIASREYDGTATAGSVVVGTAGNLVGTETLGITGAAAAYSGVNVGSYHGVTVSYSLADGSNGGLAGNYQLGDQTASGAITAKTLAITAPVIASRKYDGTTAPGSLTLGTLSGFVGSETVTASGAVANYGSKNVGSYTPTVSYTLADGLNGGLASNYQLAAGTSSGTILAKDLVVDGAAITVSRAYDGTTAITAGTDVSLAASALTGGSVGPNDGKYIGTENVSLAVDAAGSFERSLPGTKIPISTTVKMASGGDNGNYTLRAQPTGLTGEITGSANLDRNGAAITVASNPDIHIRNTTATRMQDGLTISSATGSVLLENSSFDGWMQRSTPNQTVDDGGAVTLRFTETATVAANSPVMRIKLEANNPANTDLNKNYMLLGDYQVLLRHDPDGIPMNGDEAATTVFSFPGKATDPSGIGSMAPSADLVVRDSASTQMKDLPWDTQLFSSLDGNGEAVASGSYATAAGEYKPDGPAAMSDLNTTTSAGKWDVVVDDPALNGEGKITDLRLKYNNNTKAIIEGPDGVRLLNVKFEGMDEIDVRTTDLNNRVLMSATLVTDPDISKMVVKAGSKLEAVLNSDATFREVKSLSNAELLAGVRYNNTTGLMEFVPGAERTLQINGPGAAAAVPNIDIADQLAIASHTVVFNNANISSGGVIDVRSRDGMVNRTYGSVVPGTVNFKGSNGNYFLNTGSGISMTIGNSGDITSAFTGGKLADFGSGGTGSVMNVGKVQ